MTNSIAKSAVGSSEAQASLLNELGSAMQTGSADRRIDTLRRVTDLFLGSSERLSDEQIQVFDDVIGFLINKVETKSLVELSARLAPVDNAPEEAIQHLARHDEIAVAGPVLASSPRLKNVDLFDIAKTKGQAHLLAISGRSGLGAPVTDVLLARGNRDVIHKVAGNSSASISTRGFALLVEAAQHDEGIAESAATRPDIPQGILRELLTKTTEAVRGRLMALAPARFRTALSGSQSASAATAKDDTAEPRDFSFAKSEVARFEQSGELNEAALMEFVKAARYEETAVALSCLSATPLEIVVSLMKSRKSDGLLVLCKAADLACDTLAAILQFRFGPASMSQSELNSLPLDFAKVSKSTAQHALRFWKAQAARKA